jgi:hypothetical protein
MSFNKALDISHQIGVPASTENLKCLELHQRIKDLRPLKQRKPSPDEDEISLYSVDAFMGDSADATTGNTQRYAGAGKAYLLLTTTLLDSKQEQPLHTVSCLYSGQSLRRHPSRTLLPSPRMGGKPSYPT